MALRLLVNAGLLAIPIGGSLGALLGIDAHRSATGQRPLFNGDGTGNPGSGGDSTGGGSGGSGSTTNNGVTNTQYCQLSYGISPPSDGQLYTYNPNQWAVKPDSTVGALCMNVTTFNNETYATKHTAPAFSVTWQFEPGPESQPVWAYPNVMVDDVLPIELDKMKQINFDLEWSYGVGNAVTTSSDESALEAVDLNANIAIDMFFDADKKNATSSASAKHEVMIWFGRYGASTQVIGLKDGIVTSKTVNGTTFELYAGLNGNGQNVLTWLANPNTEQFTGDLYPLITDLYTLKGDAYPSSSDFMGVFQFGTEAFSSTQNVTFSANTLSIDIQT